MKGIIKIYGGQTVDYAMIDRSPFDQAAIASGDIPEWGVTTEYRVDFSNGLIAGNASFGSQPPTSYAIYRSCNGGDLELAAIVAGDCRYVIDYAISNNAEYQYFIYPESDDYLGVPIQTKKIRTMWHKWQLLICDETDIDNRYIIKQIYDFEYDLADIQIQNNTTANILKNFTQYPVVQKDLTNAWSGTLHALVGVLDPATCQYGENIQLEDLVRELSTDTKPKFLRDVSGHLYRVDIVSPITMRQQLFHNGTRTEKSLDWVEIGALNGAIITDGGTA